MATPGVTPSALSMDLIAEYLSDSDDDSVIPESHEEPELAATEKLEPHLATIDVKDEVQVKDSGVIHAREYQLEMFEESLKRNIIVAVGRYCRTCCAS